MLAIAGQTLKCTDDLTEEPRLHDAVNTFLEKMDQIQLGAQICQLLEF